MPDEKNPNEATSFADTLHQGDAIHSSVWVEAPAVTGRPNDKPAANTTMADRAKARTASAKKVDADDVDNKAVSSARTKKARS